MRGEPPWQRANLDTRKMFDWDAVTPEAMASVDIESLLADAPERDAFAYSNVLTPLCADEARWTPAQLACLRLLQGMLQMVLHHANAQEPFGPMFVVDGRRSCVPGDIPKEVLTRLHPWAESLKDAELRARMLDVIWTQGRVFKAAQGAVQAYLASAKALAAPDDWFQSFERYERALRLAASLGRGGVSMKDEVLREVQAAVDQASSEGSPFGRRLIGLLLEFEHGDAAVLGKLASAIGTGASARGEFFSANDAHALAAECYRKAGDAVARSREQQAGAEALACEAEAALLRPGQGAMAASSIMADAVTAMRQSASNPARVAAMHAKMLEWQAQSIGELKELSTSMDVSELTRRAVESVRGKTFRDAVRTFCGLAGAPSIEALKQQVHQEAQTAVFGSLMPHSVLNHRGRVVAVIPPLTAGVQDIADDGLRGRMYRQARMRRDLNVTAVLNPARWAICDEHHPSRHEVADLIRYSACIPNGHQESVLRALLAGFDGDMLLVVHLVPPQFEAMLRHVMERAGADTSILGPTGLQPERIFKPLLELDQAKSTFGEDAIFEMQDLFVDPLGGNLRNEALHGLLSDEVMFSTEVFYAWWLLLRYCVASAASIERPLFKPA